MSDFPDVKIPGAPEPEKMEIKSAMPQAEFSSLIHHMVKLGAASALEGDIEMARAIIYAVTPLIAFAMQRWPEYKSPLNQNPSDENSNQSDLFEGKSDSVQPEGESSE